MYRHISEKFPEAYQKGQDDCLYHYDELVCEKSNPYPFSQTYGIDIEWHAYNRGWNDALDKD